jgi:hypothetical protein
LTFFARFWILSIFCALYPEKWSIFNGSFPSLRYSHFLDSIFSVPFKEMGFGFYRFFVFWPFFNFWPFFIDWIFGLIFYRFFTLFLSILFLNGSCRMWHQSGDFFFCKKPEKVEKSRKNDVFWGPKKRVEVGPFCTTPEKHEKSCFLTS